LRGVIIIKGEGFKNSLQCKDPFAGAQGKVFGDETFKASKAVFFYEQCLTFRSKPVFEILVRCVKTKMSELASDPCSAIIAWLHCTAYLVICHVQIV